MMTVAAERLEVIRIPEQFGITFMLHNVVDLELVMNHPTLGAGISRFHEDALTFTLPPLAIIQAPYHTVRALLFLDPCMGRAAPLRDQHATAGGRTELH